MHFAPVDLAGRFDFTFITSNGTHGLRKKLISSLKLVNSRHQFLTLRIGAGPWSTDRRQPHKRRAEFPVQRLPWFYAAHEINTNDLPSPHAMYRIS